MNTTPPTDAGPGGGPGGLSAPEDAEIVEES